MSVRDVFSAGDAVRASPSESLRRWDLLAAVPIVGLLVHGLALALVWRPLLGLGYPAGPFAWAWRSSFKLLAYALSGGTRCADFGERFLAHAGFAEWSRLAIAGTLAAAAASWCAWSALQPRSRVRHVEGTRLFRGKEALREARRQAARLCGRSLPWLRLHPALNLPKNHWSRHVLIYGSVGAGKTQILMPIIDELMERRAKLFLYDVKGDFTARYPEAMLLSPWDDRSRVWAIGHDVVTPAMAATFAESLIPLGPNESPHWVLTSRDVFQGVLRALQAEKGRTWGWRDLSDTLAWETVRLHALLLRYHPRAALHIDPESASTAGVRTTLAANTRVVEDLALAWGNGEGRKLVSLRKWVRDDYKGRPAIIVQGGPDRTLTSTYIAAMVNLLVPLIVSPALPDDEEGRTLAFVLDELTSLGQIELGPLVDKGRSKGVVVVAGFQDLVQVRSVYGRDFAEALSGMVGTHIVCQLQMGETRETVANLLGKRRVAATTHSRSGKGEVGAQQHEENRALVLPSDLTTRLGVQRSKRYPNGFAIRALVSIGGDVLELDFPGQQTVRHRLGFIPAAWTTATAPRVGPDLSKPPIAPMLPTAQTPLASDPTLAPQGVPQPTTRDPDALDRLRLRP